MIATGETYSVRHFVDVAFEKVGIQIEWIGEGESEHGVDRSTGKVLVEVSSEYFRPAEVDLLHGDPSKAEAELGWSRKVSFTEMVREMVEHDISWQTTS